ncbi:hypothetical protein BLL42_26430 [Pseudomonas frederiksbergensis]|uniref:Uncharacterized protein n=1 Tax=Pseudomonas frederiksbergensis TaxID=104087 RepID=A0A1J0ETC3_9PSED|nr:hypothetical protein BLL42_26430 [Pseudomonas frederiksbergensis]
MTAGGNRCSSYRACEAAFEDVVLAKPTDAVCLEDRAAWFCDGCAAERSLALLGSCYGLR